MDAYSAAYEAVLGKWPVAVEALDVRSAYGSTRVHVSGPPDGRPLVLLHGGGATSTVWYATVADLSRHHRVYAIDTIGDAGRTVNDGTPVTTAEHLMDWLDGLFTELGVDGAALAGHSYGGWIALAYALRAPARVGRLVLLDPTDCFAGLAAAYKLRAIPFLVKPSAARLRGLVTWESAGKHIDPEWLDLMCRGTEVPRGKLVMPRRPTPEALRDMTIPTLVVVAQQSRAHDGKRVAETAEALLPEVTTVALPGASHHTIPTEQPDQLSRAILAFLG
ncbi:alpha/beta fold hydrolase [Hamadaea tsunoensis]|uniref:alpha/beta fold hydrolase n=1 Tax=Hamadaea tsunoensis TaxID=53368 RepID=UPI0004197469|nr:alpha/beta hydrolase [Hamadaea tsunoensis]